LDKAKLTGLNQKTFNNTSDCLSPVNIKNILKINTLRDCVTKTKCHIGCLRVGILGEDEKWKNGTGIFGTGQGNVVKFAKM
jgi:hypothetical protein